MKTPPFELPQSPEAVPPRLKTDLENQDCFVERFRGNVVIRFPDAVLAALPADRIWAIAQGILGAPNLGPEHPLWEERYDPAAHGFRLPASIPDGDIERFLIAVYHAAG